MDLLQHHISLPIYPAALAELEELGAAEAEGLLQVGKVFEPPPVAAPGPAPFAEDIRHFEPVGLLVAVAVPLCIPADLFAVYKEAEVDGQSVVVVALAGRGHTAGRLLQSSTFKPSGARDTVEPDSTFKPGAYHIVVYQWDYRVLLSWTLAKKRSLRAG